VLALLALFHRAFSLRPRMRPGTIQPRVRPRDLIRMPVYSFSVPTVFNAGLPAHSTRGEAQLSKRTSCLIVRRYCAKPRARRRPASGRCRPAAPRRSSRAKRALRIALGLRPGAAPRARRAHALIPFG
jgi:hypothetical protein